MNSHTMFKYNKFIEMLKASKFSKISFLTGAGVSTSAGIPDFRSSSSGLFKTLQARYNLSYPEEFFDINRFRKSPALFYEFCREFKSKKYNPTLSHLFMGFIHHLGWLNYVYTQNIDGLELLAKLPRHKVVFAHGNLHEGHCSGCKMDIPIQQIHSYIDKKEIMYCDNCLAPCKPNVVFYGEQMHRDYHTKMGELFSSDLGIIMGTSLIVAPFCYLPLDLKIGCWRVVINNEHVGDEFYEHESGFRFHEKNSNDLFLQGNADAVVEKIVNDCGWKEKFNSFIRI